jgi:hypothetical protein
MKLSELKLAIEAAIAEHGDLTVFDEDHYGVTGIDVTTLEEGEFPTEWNMPDKFAKVGSYR